MKNQYTSSNEASQHKTAMKGQVVREFGQTLEVEAEGQIYSCFPRKNIDSLVIGDFVEFDWDAVTKQGVITRRLPRQSVLCRSDRYHPVKEMAANIDQILVLFAPLPKPNEFYLDQYLAAAEIFKIPVILVQNKSDLEADLAEFRALYQKIGYPILQVSAKTGAGLPELLTQLQNKTTFFLGASGVGKSSLINTLLGESVARVNQVSEANAKGQHTTSVSILYHLKNGGNIIDVPGIRELILPETYRDSMIQGFRDFKPFLGSCRFRNCAHRNDPGCVILEKVQAGEISEQRLKNYYRMLDER